MAAPSRRMLKASSYAFNLFNKSKSVTNQLPLRASALALPSAESATTRFIDQLVASRLHRQLPVWIRGSGPGSAKMLMALSPRKVVDSDEEDDDDDDDDDEFDGIDDFDDDESGEEFDGEFEGEEEDEWKKVRTRSHRDL